MARFVKDDAFHKVDALATSRLDWTVMRDGLNLAYHLLDTIDSQLIATNSPRLAELVELANLSSIFGNLIAGGIANASQGVFARNRPHAYPDLVSNQSDVSGLEIKVALETNRPKGHLPKPGYYLTFRYVLGDENGNYEIGKRKNVIWVWEAKYGYLRDTDFSISNTEGDSGKTAVVKGDAFNSMHLVYFDSAFCPYKRYPAVG